MIHFFDSSSLAKRYQEEDGSKKVDEIFDSGKDIAITNLTITEVVSALKRSENRGTINRDQLTRLIDKLLFDVANRFTYRRIDDNHIGSSIELIVRRDLKTVDAIQLAAALEGKGHYIFVVFDKRLMKAAELEGLKVLNPEE